MPPTDVEMKTLPRADPLWNEFCEVGLPIQSIARLLENGPRIPNPTPYSFNLIIPQNRNAIKLECDRIQCCINLVDLLESSKRLLLQEGNIVIAIDHGSAIHQGSDAYILGSARTLFTLTESERKIIIYSCSSTDILTAIEDFTPFKVSGVVAMAVKGRRTFIGIASSRPFTAHLNELSIELSFEDGAFTLVSTRRSVYRLMQAMHGFKQLVKAVTQHRLYSCPITVYDAYTLASLLEVSNEEKPAKLIKLLLYNPTPYALNSIIAAPNTIIASITIDTLEFPVNASVARIPMAPESYRILIIRSGIC